MALAPITPPWESIWAATISQDMPLEKLIELINRRFHGKTTPTIMATSTSRPIWTDISPTDTTLEGLIQLLNRRLSGVRIPMTPDALIVGGGSSPFAAESMVVAGRHDQGMFQGAAVYNQVGTHANIWNATLFRYTRRMTANNGNSYFRLNDQQEPRAYIDPRYGTTPVRVRARERICLTFTAPVNGAAKGAYGTWGFGGHPNAMVAGVLANYFPMCGFYASYAGVPGTIYWYCKIVDDQLVTKYNNLTAYNSEQEHELMVLLDGFTQKVLFYIDGVEVGSYTPVTNTTPGQVTPYPAPAGATAASNWQILYTASATSAVGNMILLHESHLAPGTPMVTFEFLDVDL